MLVELSTLGLGDVRSLERGLKVPRQAGLGFYSRQRKGFGGLGACTAADPSGCVGPYSSPMANYDYQLQLQQSGDVQETPAYNPPPAYTPGGPGEPTCTISSGGLQWVDNQCVANQQARSIAYQDAIAKAQLANLLQGCLDSQTPAATCYSRYPGVTPSGNLPPGTPAGSPMPSASTPPPGSNPVTINPGSVTISNVTRPGQQSFYPGDSYLVQISGASPGQKVTASSTQNGKALGTSSFGVTDTNGTFQVSGTMSADNIGNWVETWMVGGLQSGTASFAVLQAPGPTPAQSTTPPNPTQPGNTLTLQQPTVTPSGSFWSQGFQIGSYTIPFWAALLGGGVAVFAFAGAEGRAR